VTVPGCRTVLGDGANGRLADSLRREYN